MFIKTNQENYKKREEYFDTYQNTWDKYKKAMGLAQRHV